MFEKLASHLKDMIAVLERLCGTLSVAAPVVEAVATDVEPALEASLPEVEPTLADVAEGASVVAEVSSVV